MAAGSDGARGGLPLRAADAFWLQETDCNRLIVNALLVTDDLNAEQLSILFRTRLLEGEAGQRNRRFRQCVVRVHGRPAWRDDPAFSLERHVGEVDAATVERAGGVRAYVSSEAGRELPHDRPLWRADVLQDPETGRHIVFMRLHHCIGDGIALVRTMLSLIDPAAGSDRPARQPRPPRGRASFAARWLKLPIVGPLLLILIALRRADRGVLHGPKLTGRKRVAWSERLELSRIKAIKNRLGATVNDVLMAALAGAINRHLAGRGEPPMATVRASIPVDLRSAHDAPRLENRFMTVLVDLPAAIEDPVQRVAAVKRAMDRVKVSVQPMAMYAVATLLIRCLPRGLSRRIIDFYANKCTCVLTNVPGPADMARLGGRPIHDFMFWVPQRASIGLGLSILSYADGVRLGVIADSALIDDPQALVEAFEDELERLDRASQE